MHMALLYEPMKHQSLHQGAFVWQGCADACRFGVEQRARLAAKATPSPHVMYMTATPIPRTLALCEHGDLALYTIDELPPGRQPITTRVVKDTPKERAQVLCHHL